MSEKTPDTEAATDTDTEAGTEAGSSTEAVASGADAPPSTGEAEAKDGDADDAVQGEDGAKEDAGAAKEDGQEASADDAARGEGDTARDVDDASRDPKESSSLQRHDFVESAQRREPGAGLLGPVGERLCASLGEALGRRFRTPMPVAPGTVRRTAHAALVRDLGDNALLGACTLAPFVGEAWLLIDRALVFGLADRWFGGTGLARDESRPLSPSERQLLEAFVVAFCAAIEAAWRPHEVLRLVRSDNGDRDRLERARPVGDWVECDFEVTTGDGTARARLIYPGAMLSPLDERMAVTAQRKPSPSREFSDGLRSGLLGCDIELKGVLAETRITLGELMRLSAGDFIPLDERQSVSFRAGERPVFDASMGTSNGRVSASVTRVHLPIRS